MTITSNDDNNFSLNNADNFKNMLTPSTHFIVENYINLIIPYLKLILKIFKIKNSNYLKFIMNRGLDTITNVFNNLLYYTKNIELTYYHCQKSYYYYIEFIEQITDDKNIFLQLTSRDASTYVYKKTIYEITNEKRKNIIISKETNDKFDIITSHIKICKNIIYKMIDDDILSTAQQNDSELSRIDRVDLILNKINSLCIDSHNIKMFELVIEFLYNKIEYVDDFYEIIYLLIPKINKNHDLINKLKEKLYLYEIEEKINLKNGKFVNWLTEK
jgi:hypothetical protein